MKCVIVAAGDAPELKLLNAHLSDADMVIGADGAADTFVAHDIVPDMLIGDFDSASSSSISRLKSCGVRMIQLTVHKNETDTEAAITLAIQSGADDVVILGALGRRLDHTLGNLAMLLKSARAGVRCRIIDDTHEITAASGEFELIGRAGQTVSIIPLSGDVTVTANNLVYPLERLLLRVDSSRGISNIIEKSPAKITISGGYALIIKISGKA